MKHSRRLAVTPWRWLLLITLALLLAILTARLAAAENLGPGGSRVIIGDQAFGPYRLLVTSSPNPATTGTVTFVARVSDARSGTTVRDAQVEFVLTKGASALAQPATHEDAGNAIDYAAHIDLSEEGSWNGLVRVTGPTGTSEAQFVQQVTAPRTLNMVILVGIPFGAIVVVFVVMWLVRSRNSEGEEASIAQVGNK
jgi:hypothetical protein